MIRSSLECPAMARSSHSRQASAPPSNPWAIIACNVSAESRNQVKR